MLLIGSRAIRYYFPDFREPLDWDLVGTTEEIAALDRVLPRHDDGKRADKAHFRYGRAVVEVANASLIPYWGLVLERFESAPVIHEPALGELRVAPAAYLMLTKHCGLIYPVLHWHKNLEDLYFLRERITHVPEDLAALIPETLADSKRMFIAMHERRSVDVAPCHPELAPASAEHRALHAALAVDGEPMSAQPGAWDGFPDVDGRTRLSRLRTLMAEEAAVVASEQYLRPRFGFESEDENQLARWALRMLCIGRLPERFRYFLVNHYREVRDLIPKGYLERVRALGYVRQASTEPCSVPRRAPGSELDGD